jgi:hypothetical protein
VAAHSREAQHRDIVQAGSSSTMASLLSTTPQAASGCRFVQEEAPYSTPYPGAPVQYALVQMPMPMQHGSLQHPQHGNGVPMAMACPPWSADPSAPCAYGSGYEDASAMQWMDSSGTPYMCVFSLPSNGSGNGQPDCIEVPAF